MEYTLNAGSRLLQWLRGFGKKAADKSRSRFISARMKDVITTTGFKITACKLLHWTLSCLKIIMSVTFQCLDLARG